MLIPIPPAIILTLHPILRSGSVSPMIWVQNQLVGAYEGQRVTLECQSEAYPKSINYWTREKGEIVPKGMRYTREREITIQVNAYTNRIQICAGGKFEPVLVESAYKVIMKLHIRSVGPADFGSYRCVAKNSLGETDGNIKLYSTYGNLSHVVCGFFSFLSLFIF